MEAQVGRELAMQEPFEIEFELEEDGRWIAEAVDLPGVLTYGATRAEAQAKVKTLTCEVLKNLSVQG